MMKKKMLHRINQLCDVVNYPGLLSARMHGIYFGIYKMLYKTRRQGIGPGAIIDVGASTGMFSKTARYLWPDAKIYSFEPLAISYRKLQRLADKMSNIDIFNFALGAKAESGTINQSSYEYSSSILEMSNLHKEAFPHSAESTTQAISIHTLDEIFGGKPIVRPLLLKLDVQGFELNVLKGGADLLARVDHILIELSLEELYRGQPLFDEVYCFLHQKGFELIDILELLRNPNTYELLQVDALFKRKDIS